MCYYCLCLSSLYPDPPSTLRQEGLVNNIVQQFCTSHGISAVQSDWLIWQLSHLYTGLPYHKPLSFTGDTFTDLHSTLQFTEAQ